MMARPKGFEPLTPRFVVWCSINTGISSLGQILPPQPCPEFLRVSIVRLPRIASCKKYLPNQSFPSSSACLPTGHAPDLKPRRRARNARPGALRKNEWTSVQQQAFVAVHAEARRPMDHDTCEIARHLHAEITGRLERAHDLAIRRQSPRGRGVDQAEVATALLTVLDELTILAKTVTILAGSPPKRRRSSGTFRNPR